MSRGTNRRDFLRTGALAGAGLVVLKSGILEAVQSPNGKLGMAVIGVGGRGEGNLREVKGERIVAAKTDKKTLCNFDYSGALIKHNLLALVA